MPTLMSTTVIGILRGLGSIKLIDSIKKKPILYTRINSILDLVQFWDIRISTIILIRLSEKKDTYEPFRVIYR